MNIKEFYKKKDLNGPYLLMGAEKYLIENVLDYSCKKYLSELTKDLNLDIIEGEKLEEFSVIERAETLPFMGDKRILIIKDAISIIENKKGDEAFINSLFKLPITSIVFLVEGDNKIKKNSKLYKTFKKEGRTIECEGLTHSDLVGFIEKYCKKKGASIGRSDIEFFIHRSNYEVRGAGIGLFDIKNDLDKVIGLSNKNITREHIVDSMIQENTENIFDLLTNLANNNIKRALEIKKELLGRQEPVARIGFMIIRQVRLLLSYKLLEKDSLSIDEIHKKLQIKSFEAKKIQGQSRNFSLDELKLYYKYLIDLDQELKTTSVEEEVALDMLILKMGIKKTENF